MKLNVGCGTDYRKGWINLDYGDYHKCDINFDLSNIYKGIKLPFSDNYFDVINMEHVLEHLPRPLPILRELYRVCKVGGTINIEVPMGKHVWDNLDHERQFNYGSLDTNNFEYYCPKELPEVKIIKKKIYSNPSRNFVYKIMRYITGKLNLIVVYKKLR